MVKTRLEVLMQTQLRPAAEQTYYRRRKSNGGLKVDQAQQLRELASRSHPPALSHY